MDHFSSPLEKPRFTVPFTQHLGLDPATNESPRPDGLTGPSCPLVPADAGIKAVPGCQGRKDSLPAGSVAPGEVCGWGTTLSLYRG